MGHPLFGIETDISYKESPHCRYNALTGNWILVSPHNILISLAGGADVCFQTLEKSLAQPER
jgi:hypothetical protein